MTEHIYAASLRAARECMDCPGDDKQIIDMAIAELNRLESGPSVPTRTLMLDGQMQVRFDIELTQAKQIADAVQELHDGLVGSVVLMVYGFELVMTRTSLIDVYLNDTSGG